MPRSAVRLRIVLCPTKCIVAAYLFKSANTGASASRDWMLPRMEFHGHLRRLVEASFGKRIMFGSDEMVWPETIKVAIESIESAEFLNEEQRRDIFCRNAARFLRLDLTSCNPQLEKKP